MNEYLIVMLHTAYFHMILFKNIVLYVLCTGPWLCEECCKGGCLCHHWTRHRSQSKAGAAVSNLCRGPCCCLPCWETGERQDCERDWQQVSQCPVGFLMKGSKLVAWACRSWLVYCVCCTSSMILPLQAADGKILLHVGNK